MHDSKACVKSLEVELVVRGLYEWMCVDFPRLNSRIAELTFGSTPDQAGALHVLSDLQSGAIRFCEPLLATSEPLTLQVHTWVGMIFSALQRHAALGYPLNQEVTGLVERLLVDRSAQLGVASRFIVVPYLFQQTDTHGRVATFTVQQQERLFMQFNCAGIEAYRECAEELKHALSIGWSDSHVITRHLECAISALGKVRATFVRVKDEIEPHIFFRELVPFYAPVQVGGVLHQPADARDQAEVFLIDLILGLATERYCEELIVPNLPYLVPTDQERVRAGLACRTNLSSSLFKYLDLAPDAAGISAASVRAAIDQRGVYAACNALNKVYGEFARLSRHHLGIVTTYMDDQVEQLQGTSVYGQFRGLMDKSLAYLSRLIAMREDGISHKLLGEALAIDDL